MTTGKLQEPASPPDGARRGASGAPAGADLGNSGGDRPKNLLAPISKPRITVPPVRTRPCTEDIGGIRMTIEGGEGSTSIFSTLDHDAVPTRNGSRRGGRDEFVNRSTGGSTYAARVRELERHQRVPRRGDVPTNGRCYQDVHNDRRIPRDDIRNADADDAPNRPPKDTSSPYRDAIGDDPTTYSERASARGVPQRSPPTQRTDTSACNQNRRRARRNHRGRHYLRRDFRIERLPADRRPAAPYPDRHIDPLLPPRQVQELTRRTPRSSAWRHARPERRLRTQRRCPQAITAMAIPTFGLSNLLTGGTT